MLLFPQLETLKSAIQDMEKERDFYFGKLRNIELICQEKEGEEDATLSRIINILYATDVSSWLPTELTHRALLHCYYWSCWVCCSSQKLRAHAAEMMGQIYLSFSAVFGYKTEFSLIFSCNFCIFFER